MQTIPQLIERSDTLHRRYLRRFSGLPRATRILGELDAIIDTARALIADAETNTADELVVRGFRDRLQLYESERPKVAEAQAGGDGPRLGALLAAEANAVFHRYARHFAGQSRPTRDADMLSEMVADLNTIEAAMSARIKAGSRSLEQDRSVVQNNKQMYADEERAVEDSRLDLSPEQLVSISAKRANDAFAIYDNHFAGQARLSRRPELLERALRTLGEARSTMQELVVAGVETDTVSRNLGIVIQREETWQKELDEIRSARENTTVFDLVSALADEGNRVISELGKAESLDAGEDKLKALSHTLDALDDVIRQMAQLDRVYELEENARNLGLLRDTRIHAMRSWNALRKSISAS